MITSNSILFVLLIRWDDKEHDGLEECHMQDLHETNTKGEGDYVPCYVTPFITAGPWARGLFCFKERAECFTPPFKWVILHGIRLVSLENIFVWNSADFL